MNFIAIIPARFASTRFPGKPLVKIDGITMVERVYEQASKAFEQVYVATDDERIENAVKQFGGNCIMTSATHTSGTDRCAEAITLIEAREISAQVVVNVQGDEPFIQTEQFEKLKSCFTDEHVQIATLIKPIEENTAIFNVNLPKVVITKKNEAIYFSRSPIPYIRDKEKINWYAHHQFYRHIGLYAYRTDVLKEITKLPPSSLEMAESLEQNRWIENGYKIKVKITRVESIGIDTPEDLNNYLNSK